MPGAPAGVNDRGELISDIHRRGLAGQNMIAQGAQHNGQVAEPLLRGRVFFAFAVTAHHRDEGVYGGALRVEVIHGQTVRSGVVGFGHEGFGKVAGLILVNRVASLRFLAVR